MAEWELRVVGADEKTEFPVIGARINAREYAEKDIMITACAWIQSDGYLTDLLLAILGIVGLPIRDETVFLFVGYERVQGAYGSFPNGARQGSTSMLEHLINVSCS